MNDTHVIEEEERIIGKLVKALPRMTEYQKGYLVCLLDMNSKSQTETAAEHKPIYLRKSQAEREREEKLQKEGQAEK